MDKLAEMLWEQRKLQIALGHDFDEMTDEQRWDFLKTMYIAAVKELGEALDEMPWKTWSTSQRFDLAAFTSELTDTFQFIMNMWLAVMPGSTSEDLADTMFVHHMKKLMINYERIDNGYDGSNKCLTCGRALDDAHVKCTTKKCAIST